MNNATGCYGKMLNFDDVDMRDWKLDVNSRALSKGRVPVCVSTWTCPALIG